MPQFGKEIVSKRDVEESWESSHLKYLEVELYRKLIIFKINHWKIATKFIIP